MKRFHRGFLAVAVVVTTALTAVSFAGLPNVAQAAGPGAAVPYQELYAVNATYNGSIIGPSRDHYVVAGEAIGRRAVQLNSVGNYVEFSLPAQANSVVLRYSIPDASGGGGITSHLSMYINGNRQNDLVLTSKYVWRYGGYQFTNNPGDGHPFQFFDEVHTLTSQMNAGDKVRFQFDSGDTAPYFDIDIADFEQVGAPIGQPSGYLNVAQSPYNADPSGANDSTTAIRNAVHDGQAQGKGVYIPQGTYTLTGQIQSVNNVTIQGAGMWYSILHFTATSGSNTVGVFGNYLPSGVTGVQASTASTNVTLSDFMIQGEDSQRVDGDQDNGIGGAFSNSTIQNIWIEHTKCGLWLDGPMDHLTIKNMRIRDLMADGINFHQGVTNSLVSNSNIRNSGDDGLAMWSQTDSDDNSTFDHNTVQGVPFASDISIYGGSNDSVTNNIVMDGGHIQGGGLHLANDFGAVAPSGTFNFTGNQAIRDGALDPNWNFGVGALWIYSNQGPIAATENINNNEFDDSSFEAIQFIGGGAMTGFSFNNNVINGTGTFAIQTHSNATISVSGLTGNTANIGSETSVHSAIYSCSGTGFVMNQGTGNSSWIN